MNVPCPTLRAASSCTDHSALDTPLALSSTGSDHDSAAALSRPLSRVYGRKAPPPLLDLALDVQQEDIPALKPVASHFFPDNSLPLSPDIGLGLNILSITLLSPLLPAPALAHLSLTPAAATCRK
jgi:hypothetical protein